ncbi:MAG: hypothetical protein J7K72_00980 [Candidatus Aenigmarchaeota archaeon]|nr:hypothetical protein [Candidatus Aenigmarchaeota archaeon]
MRAVSIILLLAIISAVFISGCVQQQGTGGQTTGQEIQVEDQAIQTLENELDQALENITMEDLENELLAQS